MMAGVAIPSLAAAATTTVAAGPYSMQPLEPALPAWLLAGPAAPMLGADENIDPAL